MLSLCQDIFFLGCWRQNTYLDYSSSVKIFEKIVSRRLIHFLESNSLLPPSQFSYRRGQGTCDALLILSHHL